MKKPKIITEHYVVEVINELLKTWQTQTRQHRLDEIMESEAKVYVTPEEIAALKKRGYLFIPCRKYKVGSFYKVGFMRGFTPSYTFGRCVSANSRFAEFEIVWCGETGRHLLKMKRSIREDARTDWHTHEAEFRRQCAYVNERWSQIPFSYADEEIEKPEWWEEIAGKEAR